MTLDTEFKLNFWSFQQNQNITYFIKYICQFTIQTQSHEYIVYSTDEVTFNNNFSYYIILCYQCNFIYMDIEVIHYIRKYSFICKNKFKKENNKNIIKGEKTDDSPPRV